jgi:hypothetical protein
MYNASGLLRLPEMYRFESHCYSHFIVCHRLPITILTLVTFHLRGLLRCFACFACSRLCANCFFTRFCRTGFDTARVALALADALSDLVR